MLNANTLPAASVKSTRASPVPRTTTSKVFGAPSLGATRTTTSDAFAAVQGSLSASTMVFSSASSTSPSLYCVFSSCGATSSNTHTLIAPRRIASPRFVRSCAFTITANEDFATGFTVNVNTPVDTFVMSLSTLPFFTTKSSSVSSTSSGTLAASTLASGAEVKRSVTSTSPSVL